MFKYSEIEIDENRDEAVNKFIRNLLRVETDSLPLPKNLNFGPVVIHRELKGYILNTVNAAEVRDDDVWVLSLLKCGSNWLQNIAWLLTHNLDYETNKTVAVKDRMRSFACSFYMLYNVENKDADFMSKCIPDIGWHDTVPSPRAIKSFLPINLLPKQLFAKRAKKIYIARNPKDVVVSLYHFLKNLGRQILTLEQYVDLFIADEIMYFPFHQHLLQFWEMRHSPDVLFLTYEDLLDDTFGNIKKISEFLECNYNDSQLKELTENVSFSKMKENTNANMEHAIHAADEFFHSERPDENFKFIRKAKNGSYRDELSEESIRRIDAWNSEKLKDSDFKFAL